MGVNAATAYRTNELRRLVMAAKVDVEQLKEGRCTVKVANMLLSVCMVDSVICHVGRHLFPDAIRTKGNTLVLDFIERYMLQLRLPAPGRTVANMLAEDNVAFIHGNVATVDAIKKEDSFSLSMKEKRYDARWTRGGKTLLELSFPAEYMLISGQDLPEAENWVEYDIKTASTEGMTTPKPTEAMLTATSQPGYFIQKGNFYGNKEMNGNCYYRKGEADLELVDEIAYPFESCANMMLKPVPGCEYDLRITQHLYGLKKTVFTAPLAKWVSWCHNTGCDLYFGVEDFDSESLKAVVIAVNQMYNYNHMLVVKVPTDIIGEGRGDIDAEMYCFIATHNIGNLNSNKKGISIHKIKEK